MSTKAKPSVETLARCPHCHLLINSSGVCWGCRKRPEEWLDNTQESEKPMGLSIADSFLTRGLDKETGELPGQMMFGIVVPRVESQHRAPALAMDLATFNAHQWDLRQEGDTLTAAVKGKRIVVKLKSGWEKIDG